MFLNLFSNIELLIVHVSYLPNGLDAFHIEIYDERAFSGDEKVAWALHNIPEAVFEGQTSEEWVPLNGKQGDGKEGTICVVMTFTVRYETQLQTKCT